MKDEGTGLGWKFTSKLEDLDFADDVAVISSTQRHVQLKSDRLVENAERTGLRVNVGKCKVKRVNARNCWFAAEVMAAMLVDKNKAFSSARN